MSISTNMKDSNNFKLSSSTGAQAVKDSITDTQPYHAQDDLDLSRAGKIPVLKRNFGFMGILGFNCLCLNTWGGSLILLGVGFTNGGPAGLFYGFMLVWIGVLATFASLAELSSIAPVSGGQYHWVAMLAPSGYKKLLSFITGWLTVAGWQGAIAASAFIGGSLFQGFVEVVYAEYQPQLWHTTLFFYALLFISVFINTVAGPKLSGMESFLLLLYILGFFGIMVPLVCLSPHGDAKDIFTSFVNGGNWSSQTLSFFIGLSGYAFVFLGSDSAYHMSEEVKNAAVMVPRTIILGLIIDGIVALAMLLAVLFCLGDTEAILGTKYIFPFIEVFLRSTKSVAATAVMLALMIIIQGGLCLANMAAASRQLWAFARDKGVPGWRHIAKVEHRTTMPVISILITTSLSLLIGLISIGSPAAFNAVVSLSLCNLYASYFMACSLLLWNRCTGGIKERTQLQHQSAIPNKDVIMWGPWKMPGILGIAVNAFACAYLFIIFVFGLFPAATPVTPASMNWASLVMGATIIVSSIYYAVSAQKTFDGPIVETDRS